LQVLEDQITSIDEEGEEEAVAAAGAMSGGTLPLLVEARSLPEAHSTTAAAVGTHGAVGVKSKGHFRRWKAGVAAGVDARPGTAPMPGARGTVPIGSTLRRRQGGVASEDIGRLMALPSSTDWAGDFGDCEPCISQEQQKTIAEQQNVIAGKASLV
jgi:hypothetical protein